VVAPTSYADERGRFCEIYRRSWFPLGREMVQSSRSDRSEGSLVGLHYHLHQADYWYMTAGRAQVVLHDLREGSPTDGATVSIEIGDGAEQGVFIPPGVAHGYLARTDCTLTYLVDSYYNPADELGIAFDDDEVAAPWDHDLGPSGPVLSERDRANPRRSELLAGVRPRIGLRA
jgi:dTDP-4-dehydrorhamnose 3,5-epimerase